MRILLIQAHPDKDSYNYALGNAYLKGAESSGAEVKVLVIHDLKFDPVLHHGYRQRTELEPDLVKAQELITWAEHLVLVYPTWWGSVPGYFKGFIDRVLLPGFAFKKRENSPWWDKYLTGKSARIITTLDTPGWYFRIFYGNAGHVVMKKLVLNFNGIKPVRVTHIAPIRLSKPAWRHKWLLKVERLGARQA